MTTNRPPPDRHSAGNGRAADLVARGAVVVQSTGRLVAYINDPPGSLRLTTTRGNDAVARFPELTGLPAGLELHQVVLDGEVVAFQDGRPSFGRLQHRMHLSRPAEIARVAPTIPVCYVVFDLLHLDGDDLTQLPYTERRRLLAEVVEPGDGWLMPAHHFGGGADLLEAARTQQLEGIMAKRLDSPYLPGRRSPAWRTMCRRRAGVIDVVHRSDPRRWPAWMTGCV